MHNGKYHTLQYKTKQQEKVNRIYGPVKNHLMTCEGKACLKHYTWTGRKKTKAYNRQRFCSRSCANNRIEQWRHNARHYRTICFYHWEKKCHICGYDKIVSVHHIDENKENNEIHNLIPLCQNCHSEVHHNKYAQGMKARIKQIVEDKFTDPDHRLHKYKDGILELGV